MIPDRERRRRASNTDRALALLQARGSRGATNAELIEVAGYRYGGRLHELRREWHIDSVQEQGGCWRFILRGRRQPVQQGLSL